MKVPINGSLFTIKEVNDPICRNGKTFPVQVRYADLEICLLKTLPEAIKKDVLAAAVGEACRLHRVPLIWPKWAGD